MSRRTNLHSWPLIIVGIGRRKNGVSASHRKTLQSPNQPVESGRRSPNRRVRSANNASTRCTTSSGVISSPAKTASVVSSSCSRSATSKCSVSRPPSA